MRWIKSWRRVVVVSAVTAGVVAGVVILAVVGNRSTQPTPSPTIATAPSGPRLGESSPATDAPASPPRTPRPRTTAAVPAKSDRPAPITEASVRFAPGLSAAEVAAIARREGFRVVERIPHIGWTVIEPTRPGLTAADLSTRLVREGVAGAAEPAHPVRPAATATDPRYSEQWGFNNVGQSGGTVGADSNAQVAWNWARGDGVVVAVIDTGVDFGSSDLVGKAWVNPGEIADNGVDDDHNGKIDDVNGWDFLNGDATVFDAADGDKHGTHVSGTIGAATNNGIGGAGMAWKTSIMSLKFLSRVQGSDAAGAAALVYAVDNGADVINCSWGGGVLSQVVSDAVAYAASHDVLVVAAAGNATTNTDVTPFYPASLSATNVVSVASLTRTDGMSSFSNYGAASVDLGAPGSAIFSSQSRLSAALFIDRAAYRVAYYAFPIESITSDAVRDTVIARSMARLATTTADPVLLVDDSYSASLGQTATARRVEYLAALGAAGYTNVTVHSTATSGTPTLAALQGKTVVWFNGAATLGYGSAYMTLNTAERTVLGSYLDGGGRLLLSSGELGYDTDWAGATALTWYRNYMRASFADDDPWTGAVTGRTSGALDGLGFQVVDAVRATDGCDDVAAADAFATSLADWEDFATISGTSMATPHVTGAVALAYSRTPTATATELKTRLLATVKPVAALAGKTVTGGRLDAAALVGTMRAPAPLLIGPAGSASNRLIWRNPVDDSYFQLTRVLVRVGADPTGPDDASAQLVYEGTAETALHEGLTANSELHYAAYSRNSLGSWSAAATATVVFTPPTEPGAPIPVGTDVSVTVGDVTLRFPQVTAPGWLSVTRIPPRETAPTGLQWVTSGYYDIHPVGTFATPVDLTISFTPTDVSGPPADLRLLHRNGTVWDPITTGVSTGSSTICGRVNNFSDFGIAEASTSTTETVSTPATSEWSVGLILVIGLGMAVRVRAASRVRRGAK